MNLKLNYEGFEENLMNTEKHRCLYDVDGIQYLFRFDNNYGASVIKHSGSYGYKEDLWELAVIKFYGDGIHDWNLNYETPITDDVIGWQTDEGIRNLLQQIKELKNSTLLN